jgi:hypothetical protein
MKLSFPEVALALALCGAAGCAQHGGAAARDYPYNKPLSSLGAKFSTMPLAAQNTVLAEAGTAEIADVVKKSTAEGVYFKVYFKESRNFPTLYVAPDGAVLHPDLTIAVPAPPATTDVFTGGPVIGVRMADLPANVAKVVQSTAPNAEISSIRKEIWGNHVVYVIVFKDAATYPDLHVIGDGAMLYSPPAASPPRQRRNAAGGE